MRYILCCALWCALAYTASAQTNVELGLEHTPQQTGIYLTLNRPILLAGSALTYHWLIPELYVSAGRRLQGYVRLSYVLDGPLATPGVEMTYRLSGALELRAYLRVTLP